MLTLLKSLFKEEVADVSLPSVLQGLLVILAHFEENKLKDGTSRNAAIDTLIGLLENEKTA